MVTLEQIKLLESKVARAIEYVERVSGENALLQGKLDSYQKRIDELEVIVQQFKEEQGRIEDGILSALDRLNQFEDAIEKSISPEHPAKLSAEGNKPAKTAAPRAAASAENIKAAPRKPEGAPQGALELEEPAPEAPVPEEPEEESVPGNPVLFSEDPEESLPEQVDGASEGDSPEDPPPEEVPSGELDIF